MLPVESRTSARSRRVAEDRQAYVGERHLSEWCAVYINLARRPDRRERLLKLLGAQNSELLARLTRIDAVDGRDLSFDDEHIGQIIDEQALDRAQHAKRRGAYTIVHNGGRLVHFDDHLTLGGVACAMSHRMALEAVASHPTASWGLILEDDLKAVAPRVEEAMLQVLRRLPPDWDAVFLGYHDNDGKPHSSAMQETADGEREELEDADVPNVRLLTEPLYGLAAYVVRKEAAKALVEHAFPIGSQVDHAISKWLVQERGRSYKVEAGGMLFFAPKSEEAEDSDVQTMATVGDMMEKYESWEGYYNHIWGLDAYFDDMFYDEEEEEELRRLFPFDGSLPPCEVPTPDCTPTDFHTDWNSDFSSEGY